jgi:purine-binding chemotaxis protein CheW
MNSAQDNVVMMCSFHAGAGLFGMDTKEIREVLGGIRSQAVPLAPRCIDGVVAYRGDVLTTLSLRELMGLEKRSEANCVLVLDDEQDDERFGLVVDDVGGVLMVPRTEFDPNQATLDERSMYLFDGTCRTEAGLMVRLDPKRLRPSQLAANKMFRPARQRGEV